MAQRREQLDGIGEVILQKRRSSKHLRLSISNNIVRVSMPIWTPYYAGRMFALQKRDWIIKQKASQAKYPILDGGRIGKSHRFVFEHVASISHASSRIQGQSVVIRSPSLDYTTTHVQEVAERAGVRALKKEAEALLVPRLASIAKRHGFNYSSVHVKRMRTRWGSCSNKKVIALNIFLMQLSWELIDYVILHELVHTEHMNHSQAFWQRLEQLQPNAKAVQKQLRKFQPTLMTL